MKNFLKQNWFKIFIAIVILVIIGGVLYFFIFRTYKTTNEDLTIDEINQISKSVVKLRCAGGANYGTYVYGSGTYIHRDLIDSEKTRDNFTYLDGYILTNQHVAGDSYFCQGGLYNLPIPDEEIDPTLRHYWRRSGKFFYNDTIDVALLRKEILRDGNEIIRPELSDNMLKSYLLNNYPICQKEKIIGSKVYVFGYPAGGSEYVGEFLVRNLIVSTGIISGTDSSGNYYTDAQIDSGSSGGLAVAKINGEICIVGIPTWTSFGEFESLGMIQPFRKVLNVLHSIDFDAWDISILHPIREPENW